MCHESVPGTMDCGTRPDIKASFMSDIFHIENRSVMKRSVYDPKRIRSILQVCRFVFSS